ncbi:MAG: ABC transporter ATP-binding protein [Veillonella sp.]|nr:ABC transporter ATP-binding protein [Veillonella sp.]
MEANTDANRDSSEDSNEDAGKDFNKGSNKASNKDSDEGANSKTGLALGAKETAKSDIVIENLTTGYDKKAIIDHLNLTIPRGKITTLIGANGCGKSTLLKTICRIIKPMNGAVYLDGTSIHDVPTHELAKKLAILPQHPTAPEGLTVRELISYGRAPYRNGIFSKVNKEDKAYVDWALEITHLKELADRPIHSLSGGQRQRAWIAMAVAQDTDILFLDEPTSFLDIAHQLEVLQLVDYLNTKFGKTIVMVLHELNQAARFADNIIAMKAGEVRFQGTPEDVITDEMLRDVFNITAMIMRDPVTRMPFCIPQYVGGGL